MMKYIPSITTLCAEELVKLARPSPFVTALQTAGKLSELRKIAQSQMRCRQAIAFARETHDRDVPVTWKRYG